MLKRLLMLATATLLALVSFGTIAPSAHAATDPYTSPGQHFVNDRYWRTECENYSPTVIRCRTEIWASTVVTEYGSLRVRDGWVFNNLTYLASNRDQWGENPLANNAAWTDDAGRAWRTECDTEATGRNGCRTYTEATVTSYQNGKFVRVQKEVFNNLVHFSTTGGVEPVTAIPPRTPDVAGFPVEPDASALPVTTCRASYYWQGSVTANGERYDPDGLTAAHRTLPFNTMVRVVNRANGKEVVVRINDRGPFIYDRCMDLSRGAMTTIGGTAAGVISIDYQVLPG